MNNYIRTYTPHNTKKNFPLFSKIFFISSVITVIIHVVSAFSPRIADFITVYIGAALRFLLSSITGLLPFSLAEGIFILLPVIIIVLLIFAAKRYSDSFRDSLMFSAILASVACLFYTLFFWSFGSGYNSTPIEEQLGLKREDVSAEELYNTANILAEKINEDAYEVFFRNGNFSVMPYNIKTLNSKLNSAYKNFTQDKNNKFVSKLNSNIKPVILSEAMSYTHITGLYSYFTGEANINIAFPDYTLPYTAAHEMAHQRGIAREDEANFVAFLVCIGSDDAYIRYSAYMGVLEYVLNALYTADTKLYTDVVKKLDISVRYEMIAYGEFFKKYQNSTAGDVSEFINNTHLTLNGTAGTKSYGMVVDLAVAYYKKNAN